MENSVPQRESRVVLAILGLLLTCVCLSLGGIGYLVATRSEEIANAFKENSRELQSPHAPPIIDNNANWSLIYEKHFERIADLQTMWIGHHKEIYGEADFVLEDARYKWTLTPIESMSWTAIGSGDKYKDFDLRVTAFTDSRSNGLEYGLLFGFQDNDNFYTAYMDEQPRLLLLQKERGTWYRLAKWDNPQGYRMGTENELRVIRQNSRFVFLINDTFVGEFTETKFPVGKVGLAAEMNAPHTAGTVWFDNLSLRTPNTQVTPTQTPEPSLTPRPPITRTATPTGSQVPNVIGVASDKALIKLRAAHLQADFVVELSAACAGLVYRQEPTVGTFVERNSFVKLFVCSEVTSSQTPTPVK